MLQRFGNALLHYQEVGSGRPILMLHGWPLDHLSMIGAMEPIFAHRDNWKRIYVDLPGMGKSESPDWVRTQDQILGVLTEFILNVISDERFCVVGLSYGGLLAQGLIHRFAPQMDGVMFLVPSMASIDESMLPRNVAMHKEPLDFSGLTDEMVRAFEGMAVVQMQAHLEAWKKYIFPGTSAANHAFLDRLQAGFPLDVEQLPQPFVAPTLFLLGRQDVSVGYRDAWRIIESYPHASYVILDRAGHCLQMEQPRLYDALVHEWLDRVEEFAVKNVNTPS